MQMGLGCNECLGQVGVLGVMTLGFLWVRLLGVFKVSGISGF